MMREKKYHVFRDEDLQQEATLGKDTVLSPFTKALPTTCVTPAETLNTLNGNEASIIAAIPTPISATSE